MERIVGIGAQRTGRSFEVLLIQHGGDVGRHQTVGSHAVGLEPDAQRVVRPEDGDVADTRNARQLRFDMDFEVVVKEFLVVAVVGTVQGDDLRRAVLAFAHRDAGTNRLGGQETLRLRDAVLHVHRRNIGIRPGAEIDRYGRRTVVRRR